MNKIAIAVLLLFSASLFGNAFAAGCIMHARAPTASAQLQPGSMHDNFCAGRRCSGPQEIGCATDLGSIAVAEKSRVTGDLARSLKPTIIPVLSVIATTHAHGDRAKVRPIEVAPRSGYAGTYARTGRLLI